MAQPRDRWAPAGAGALVLGALTALDLAWSDERVIIAAVVLAPCVPALRGEPRATLILGVLATVVCAASGLWNDNLGEVDYLVRLLVVGGGAAFAVAGARSRARVTSEGERFRLLAAAAELGDRTSTVEATVARVHELVVPSLADACVIEIERGGGTARYASSPAAEAPDEGLGDRRRIDADLRSRGRRLGRMTLLAGGGRAFAAADHEFAGVLAGRVALALDNAGLSSEVEALEARLSAALGTLAEAVTVQDRTGQLIYANQAAARSLGFGSPEELLATPLQEIVDAFDSYLEDGTPLTVDMLPGREVLAGREPDPLVVRAIHRATGEERWRITKATAVHDREGRPVLAVNVIEDVTEVKRAELTQRFLAAAGEVLASSLDYEETLTRITRLVVPELADWCSVALPDEHGYLRAVAVAHADPAKVRIAREYNRRFAPHVSDEAGSAQVFREGVSQVINDISDELLTAGTDDPEQLEIVRSLGMRAAMIVPMAAASGVIGTISFVSAESGRPFTDADRAIAEELGRRAGAAVENARLYTERSRIAHTLQMSLLPDELPDIPGVNISSFYRPAGEETFVGGDFYDALETDRGWMVVIGDVTGRGADAAALTAQARHTLRTAALLLGDPVAAIGQLNRALVAQPDLPLCTIAVVLLAREGDRTVAHVTCAGHPQPLLLRAGDVRAVGAPGPMVGAWHDAHWRAEPVELDSGDVLVLFTDGVIDAVGADGRFGEERLAAVLRGAAGAADVVGRVDGALRDFERGEQADDTAVVALQQLPGALAAAGASGGRRRERDAG